MHFDILVEDQSGEKMLNVLIPKIIGNVHTFRIKSYKGIGRIPKNMKDPDSASNHCLMDNLPKLLKGYGKTHSGYGPNYRAVVFLVCDLDRKDLKVFRGELLNVLNACNPIPNAQFCIAIEEGEAWFLGDMGAIKAAYPRAKDAVLNEYKNDSICGTWELLANALYSGGVEALSKKGWQAVGREKSVWAEKITPNMNINNNNSPSFCYFRDKLRVIGTDIS